MALMLIILKIIFKNTKKMNNKKIFKNIVIILFILLTFTYLSFSYILLEFNLLKWGRTIREKFTVAVFCCLTLSCFFSGLIEFNNDN
jgi:hypothetical protein